MKVVDLFSGIGGMALGFQRAGATIIAFCEIDPFCKAVLRQHWPEVPILDDVRTAVFPAADVVCGGFPCQDVSRAGKRAGLAGRNSGLYRELVRAIRLVRPKHAIVENVAALLNDGMGTVLGDLAEIGYDAEWDCVPAVAVGAPHERDRVWIVAHADSRGEQARRPQSVRRRIMGEGEGPGTGLDADTSGDGRGSGRPWRPPDSFARVRDEARRNAADPYGARLAFREGLRRDAFEERPSIERKAGEDGPQSIWPDEPALLGVDDGVPDRVDRVKALGNSLIPMIPELIALELIGR